MKWKDLKVVVVGLGASGLAAARLLKESGAEVTVRDESENELIRNRAQDLIRRGIRVELGQAICWQEVRFDLGILSPGIDPLKPLVQNFEKASVPLWSELELAYRFCATPIIAITGTNGKTTTTELVHHILTVGGKRSCAAGNIGLALSEVVYESHERDVTVVEASSFQLERIVSFRPKVAALLNVTPDHMDRYRSMSDYLAAKLRIFENQEADDLAIINASLGSLNLKAKTVTFSAHGLEADYTLKDGFICHRNRRILQIDQLKLKGYHNVENVMVAIAIAQFYEIEESVVVKALTQFQSASHRCEFVAEIDEVSFVNDSKATNVDAVAQAIESFQTPIILIAGGKDKGFEFDSISNLVAKKTRAIFLIGETAKKMKQAWSEANCIIVNSLQEAVEKSKQTACPGDVVLLSPACSSFDMFRDYADRGNQFKALVKALSVTNYSTTINKGDINYEN